MNYFKLFPSIMALLMAHTAHSQVTWQTTHSTRGGYQTGACSLERATLRVGVAPAYLDIEEDVELAPQGQIFAGNDANTLEITGNFQLPNGGAITGALLWDGTRILEGKLLDRKTADSLYENLVDRNSTPPPRPRDPLILEQISQDSYRFRIYPAQPGMIRHLRLRYQLPPTIGVQGLEISLKAAITSLFPNANLQVPVTLENRGQVSKILFATGAENRTEMILPRTRLMKPADLKGESYTYGGGWTLDGWGNQVWSGDVNPIINRGIYILPMDSLRQVSIKTSFPSGSMKGNYLNLYTGVTDKVLAGLHQRIEVVIYWKWHNPGTWITKNRWGDEYSPYLYQAQSQAGVLVDLYSQLGGTGTKIGLLHDDSRINPTQFKTASRGEPTYVQAKEYLQSIQENNYVETFVRGIKVLRNDNNQPLTVHQKGSKDRFLTNMRLVKTLYSPDSGIVRHLLVISAGEDYLSENYDMNPVIDSLFQNQPVTLAGIGGYAFNQVGFDFVAEKRNHAYKGPTAWTPWGEMPTLPALNLNVVVRNTKKAYDFDIACTGGMDNSCGTLTFHGKSDEVWNDTLEWQAFEKSGKLVATTRSIPKKVEVAQDTATAILWASSVAPFSEKKELPLGPVYGFVDRWASLLSLKKDSLTAPQVYADTGVPRIANNALKDVIPNYADGQTGGVVTGIVQMASSGSLNDPTTWRIERIHGNILVIRIPGLSQGLKVGLSLFDINGKLVRSLNLDSQSGALNFNVADFKPGLYILKIKVAGIEASRRITL